MSRRGARITRRRLRVLALGRDSAHGAPDEFGYKAVENVATIYDLHATILHLVGLDHERLSFYHDGAERRLTDVHGEVLQDILA